MCNILIYGANEKGITAYQAFRSDKKSSYNVVGFIDDEPNKYRKNIHGIKVLGNRHHIKDLSTLYKVEEIILAKTNSYSVGIADVIKTCNALGIRYRVLSSLWDNDINESKPKFLPDIKLKVTDLFPNKKLHVDYHALKNLLTDKTVLLNGTGGALGQELCSKILQLRCKKLIIVERYESYLAEFLSNVGNPSTYDLVIPLVNGNSKTEILAEVFEKHKPDIVIHAGTRKYTPLVYINTENIGEDNYANTFNLARMAAKFNSHLFLMISSLGAIQNESLITASLRIAEVCLENFFKDTATRLIIARIGDIIESRGGVVSNIENQIRNKQAVILPTPDIKTSLMSKYDAASFILQALVDVNSVNNEKRVFSSETNIKMSLVEITNKLASMYGLKIGIDIPIIHTSQNNHSSIALKKPLTIDHKNSQSVKTIKSNILITSENAKTVFKDFMNSNSEKPIHQNWKEETNELFKICEKIIE